MFYDMSFSCPLGLFNKKQKRPRINKKIMDEDKIKTPFDVEDIGDKKVFCRCWQSNKVSCIQYKFMHANLILRGLMLHICDT